MPDYSPGTPWGDAVQALAPILDAERARGNTGRLSAGTGREDRPGYGMRHPLDVNALRAQFAFGDGIRFLDGARYGAIVFLGRGGTEVFGIGGGGDTGFLDRRRRKRWWRNWNADPRIREPFANPFAGLNG
jgi:hypothetical protein